MPALDQFIVERYLEGSIVEWDLPLHDVEISRELNGPLIITGVLTAKYVQDLSGGIGLFPYNDCIHWMHDGVLKGGALIQPLSFDEEGNVLIEARGWSTMIDVPIINGFANSPKAAGGSNPRTGEMIQDLIFNVNDNVLNKQLGFFLEFSHAFSYWPTINDRSSAYNDPIDAPPTGNTPPSTGSIGSATWGGGSVGNTGGGIWGSLGGGSSGSTGGSSGSSGSSDIGSGSAGSSGSTGTGSLGGIFPGPPTSSNSGKKTQGASLDRYIIMPWEAVNCYDEIQNLLTMIPADMEEREVWDGDTNNIKKTLYFAKDRIGQPRTNLRFVEGENILAAFSSSTSADDYCNAVLIVGAGEEKDRIMAYQYLDVPNTARRVMTIEDETIYNVTIAKAIANFELAQRSQAIHIAEIKIDIQHPNCRLNDVRIGDDIRVFATIPFLGRQAVWHRITGIGYEPGSQAMSLKLARSDSFNYVFGAPTDAV